MAFSGKLGSIRRQSRRLLWEARILAVASIALPGFATLSGSLRFGPPETIVPLVGMLSVTMGLLFPNWVARRLMVRQMRAAHEDLESAEGAALTERTAELAKLMGLPAVSVCIQGGRYGTRNTGVRISFARRTIYVTRRTVERTEPDEMDFLLAHELAHLAEDPMRDVYKAWKTARLAMYMNGGVLFMSCWCTMTGDRGFAVATMLLPLIGLPTLFCSMMSLRRRHEYEADRIALETTGNVEAAVSALSKLKAYSRYPPNHETEFVVGTHPRVSKRIIVLQRAGEQIRAVRRSDEAVSEEHP